MDLVTLKKIAPSIDAEIAAVFAKHGLKVMKRNASVDALGGGVSWRIQTADTKLKDESGAETTAEAEFYKKYHGLYGMKLEWLGKEFSAGGLIYILRGMRNTRSAKNVCITRKSDGRELICEPRMVIAAMK